MPKPPDFHIIAIDAETGLESQGEGFRCCHCGRMHLVAAAIQGVILKRPDAVGFCARCGACRCAGCVECVPEERQIDNIEAGRDRLTSTSPFAAFPRNPLVIPEPFPGK